MPRKTPPALRRQIGVVFQAQSVDPKLTAYENLWHQGHLYGLRGSALKTRVAEILDRVGWLTAPKERVETFSGGMQRRIELAKGLLHHPGVLLLDEPTTGLDPGARRDLVAISADRCAMKNNVSVLVTTHLMEEAERCDRLAIMNEGNLVALGTPDGTEKRNRRRRNPAGCRAETPACWRSIFARVSMCRSHGAGKSGAHRTRKRTSFRSRRGRSFPRRNPGHFGEQAGARGRVHSPHRPQVLERRPRSGVPKATKKTRSKIRRGGSLRSMILVLSLVLGVVPLLGVVWIFVSGMIVLWPFSATVDGLFMTLILLTLSGCFFLNAYWEMRDAACSARRRPPPPRLLRRKRVNMATQSSNSVPATGARIRGITAARLHPLVARDRALLPPAGRVVGVLASPLVFWLVIGSGFGTSFRSGGGPSQQHYLDYFYPGALIMIVLFTSIFTMMSVIDDRKEGFLLSVLVAPVPRSAIVLGKVLGGTTLSAIQGMIFLIFAPFTGVHLGLVAGTAGGGGGIPGFVCSDCAGLRHRLAHGFFAGFSRHRQSVPDSAVAAVGLAFSLGGASGWIRALMRMNPLTYGVEALRGLLYPGAATLFPLSSHGNSALVFAGHVRTLHS